VTRLPRWTAAFGALLAVSSVAALLIVPILASESPYAEVMFLGQQYALTPLAALAMPAFAAYRGVEPYAAFFPPFVCQWLLPPLFALQALPVSVLLCFLLGVIGANAGKELRRRNKTPR
jgi:hypothetical protein